ERLSSPRPRRSAIESAKLGVRRTNLLRSFRGDVDLVYRHFDLEDQTLGHVFDARIAESHFEQESAKTSTLRLSHRRAACFLPAKLQYSRCVAAHDCPADGNAAIGVRQRPILGGIR